MASPFFYTREREELSGAPGLAVFQTWVGSMSQCRPGLENRETRERQKPQVSKIARPGAPGFSVFLRVMGRRPIPCSLRMGDNIGTQGGAHASSR